MFRATQLSDEEKSQLILSLAEIVKKGGNGRNIVHFIEPAAVIFRWAGIPRETAQDIISKAIEGLEVPVDLESVKSYVFELYEMPNWIIKDKRAALAEIADLGGEEIAKLWQNILKIPPPLEISSRMSEFELRNLNISLSWLIPNLLPEYGVVVLAGKGGVGKSFLALHMAKCIINGGSFLKLLQCQKAAPVLIFDKENYLSILKQRLELFDPEGQSQLYFNVSMDLFLDQEDTLEVIRDEIADLRPALVIFDSWTQFLSKTNENDAIAVNNVIINLRNMAINFETCFLIIHHLRKNLAFTTEQIDELRGSSALVNSVDIVLLLRGLHDRKALITVKNRMAEPRDYAIRFGIQEGRVVYEGEELPRETEFSETAKVAKAIREYLTLQNRPVKRSELEEVLEASSATITRALQYLLAMGVVERVRQGVYRLKQTELQL